MLSSKNSILCILDILEKYSDENHILNATDIQKYLKNNYELEVDRRTIYRNISNLCEFGFEISTFEENKTGYYLVERRFLQSELTLLINAVASAKFIPMKETDELIEKLQKLNNIYSEKIINDVGIYKSCAKTLNRDIFYNIEVIQKCIKEKKKISFTYCIYDLNKKLVPKREEKYIVSPYGIVCTNENYYLISNSDKYDDISNYRVDFIKDIEVLNEKSNIKDKNFTLEKHINSSVYMFAGEKRRVKIICDNVILKDVIDRFGDTVTLTKVNENSFCAYLNIELNGIEFWIMQYIDFCEVIEPIELRETIKEKLKRNLGKYE